MVLKILKFELKKRHLDILEQCKKLKIHLFIKEYNSALNACYGNYLGQKYECLWRVIYLDCFKI